MNGPDHYREAEHHLEVAESELQNYAEASEPNIEAMHLAHAEWAQMQALTHATLALTAATVEVAVNGLTNPHDWTETLS